MLYLLCHPIKTTLGLKIDVRELDKKYNMFAINLYNVMIQKNGCKRGCVNSLLELRTEYEKIYEFIEEGVNKSKIENNLKLLSYIYVAIVSTEESENSVRDITLTGNNRELTEEEKLIDKMIETEKYNLRIMKKKKMLSELILEKEKEEKDINISLLEALDSDKKNQIEFVNLISKKIMTEEEMRDKLISLNNDVPTETSDETGVSPN